jgi:vanillate O-demethylase ferredoxin subunit
MSLARPDIQLRVAAKLPAAEDICALELHSIDGAPLPAFSAGAHIDLHLGDGLVRQYSLAGSPADSSRYLLGVLLEPASRGGSAAVHRRLRVGDLLGASLPRNHFALDPDAPHSLLLAGGIGVTPLLSMAEQLQLDGRGFELHYCTRSAARTAFAERLRDSAWAARVRLHHDDAEPAQRLDLARTLADAPPATHLYVCGPRGFIDWVLQGARDAGWDEARLHREYFAADPAPAADGGDAEFDVELASSSRVVRVPPGQTIVQALGAAGVDVPTSCEQGICGTCLTRVLAGTPLHRDSYLTDDERAAGDQMLPCCSRAAAGARLVLDL